MDLTALNLTKPLVFFDLETTGLDVVTDRIIQIAAVKIMPDKTQVEYNRFINPQMPISSTHVHGITSERVANEPTFNDLADEIYDFLADADLAGYNIKRFDVPVLMEEFDRAGIRFRVKDRSLVDAQEIFFKMEPRTLAGALRYYCKEEMVNAHDALADVQATIKVLAGQLVKYKDASYISPEGEITENAIKSDVLALHEFTKNTSRLDATNRLKLNEQGEIVFNFGKHKGHKVEDVFRKENSYYHWLQDKNFSIEVKEITHSIWESMNT